MPFKIGLGIEIASILQVVLAVWSLVHRCFWFDFRFGRLTRIGVSIPFFLNSNPTLTCLAVLCQHPLLLLPFRC